MVAKHSKQKHKGFDLVKNIGYVLVIVLIFSPLTFLISNTITGVVSNDCYQSMPKTIDETYDYAAERSCQKEYDHSKELIERKQFLIVSIISIIAIGLLLLIGNNIDSVISYSLFFASALNTIIIVIKNSYSSLVAALLGVVLFILVLLFINKNLKK